MVNLLPNVSLLNSFIFMSKNMVYLANQRHLRLEEPDHAHYKRTPKNNKSGEEEWTKQESPKEKMTLSYDPISFKSSKMSLSL